MEDTILWKTIPIPVLIPSAVEVTAIGQPSVASGKAHPAGERWIDGRKEKGSLLFLKKAGCLL